MREESRERGSIPRWGVQRCCNDWSLSTLSGGGAQATHRWILVVVWFHSHHDEQPLDFLVLPITRSILQLLSIFRARHGCSVALSLAVCRWLKSEFVWMCSPIRQPPPMHAHSLARSPRLLRSGHASVLVITNQDAAEHACKRAREHPSRLEMARIECLRERLIILISLVLKKAQSLQTKWC